MSRATDDFDLVVVGGGSGGIATARRAAAHGARVALVEAGPLGGTCVNVGCVPKKLMWNAAEVADTLADAADFGFSLAAPVSHDFGELVRRRTAVVERLVGVYERGIEAAGVTLLRGRGRLCAHRQVEVAGRVVTGAHVLIATGGRPRVPDLPGAELGLTSDGFFRLTELPRRVAVVGAGYIAVELATVLRALGAEVTMLLRGEMLLRTFDATVRDALQEELTSAGISVLSCIHLQGVERTAGGQLALQGGSGVRHEGFDVVLWAIGRAPNTEALGLEEAGVRLTDGGFIEVDAWQDTSATGVHAVGDVTGRAPLTPVAIAAGRRLADRLFGGQPEARLDYDLVPTVVFGHPPLATVGLTEDEAVDRFGSAVKCYTARFVSLWNALTERKPRTIVKLVTVGPDERVLGVHVLGRGADEIIQGFAVAVSMGARKADLDRTIAVHPTVAEELVTLR